MIPQSLSFFYNNILSARSLFFRICIINKILKKNTILEPICPMPVCSIRRRRMLLKNFAMNQLQENAVFPCIA